MGAPRQIIRRLAKTALQCAIAIAAIGLAATVAGCAAMCVSGNGGTGGASDNSAPADGSHSASAEASHRPPSPFPDGPIEDSETAPAQVVNVFGEVNGVKPKPATLGGDGVFQQHTSADEGYDTDVAVDPAGKWLVYSSTRHSEHPNIYLQRVDGTSVIQLTDGSDDAHPVFSPDGKQIAFSSTRAGAWQIFLMDRDGRNITQLTNGAAQSIHPSFSPDGQHLAYCSLGVHTGQWELWIMDIKSGEKRMIGYGLFPSWSPTGDKIAFQRARQRGSRWFSLWTIDLVDGEGRRATEISASANAAILTPCWSPDGRRLAFATVLQTGKNEARKVGQTDIWTVEADGANRQRLTDGRGSNLMPFWAVDNRVFFVSDRGGAESVWSVRTEGASKPSVLEAAGGKREKTAVGSAETAEPTNP